MEQMLVDGCHHFHTLHWGAGEPLPQPFAPEALAFWA
jgi:hypothetical protein